MQQTQYSTLNTVIRMFGQSYAAWFQASKSFVLFEEPAIDVYQLYIEGHTLNDIVSAISVKEGAAERLYEFYPELKEMNQERAFTGKQVRYLPVYNQTEINEAPYQVKALDATGKLFAL